MRTTHTTQIRRALSAIALGVLLLSGCGGTDEPSASPSGSAGAGSGATTAEPGSGTDVAFATTMIRHHGQAIEMADLALSKATNAKVKDLAERVKAAQDPEITTLSGLLRSWGAPAPTATGKTRSKEGSMEGMGHGDSNMMTGKQMDDLETAGGAEFDQMWVDMMITHHEGAVEMSKAEISDGLNTQVKQLAQTITDAQTKEIGELRSLRTELG